MQGVIALQSQQEKEYDLWYYLQILVGGCDSVGYLNVAQAGLEAQMKTWMNTVEERWLAEDYETDPLASGYQISDLLSNTHSFHCEK